MTKKQRYNICASAYLELRRVERLSLRRSPVRSLGKRAAPRIALFESAFLVSSKARRFFFSRAPDFQVQGAVASTEGRTPGLETADGPTQRTLQRAFEEKNAKNAEIICKGSGVGCRVVEPS